QTLDLNATANEATGSGNVNAELEGTQNGQPPPRNPVQGNRSSAFDRIGPSDPNPRPFGGTGLDGSQICPRTKASYAGDGVGSSGIEKGERRTSLQHEEPSASGPSFT
ncbi:hypothetical protein PIB30_115053, partial [Stylosanthes scabra]|nr:hypothetical protein [Stylosanthes scabra]